MPVEANIYTDGASRGNGSSNSLSGWGYVLFFSDVQIPFTGFGGKIGATNQEMELTAAVKALNSSRDLLSPVEIRLFTDSAYLCNCFKNNWWKKWEVNGWENAKGDPIANKELWEQLIPWFKKSNFSIIKVKGHSGNKWNEMADVLANKGADACSQILKNIDEL